MTLTAQQRISATLAQPAIYVSRRGEALTRPQMMRRAVKPKPVTLAPLPEEWRTQ